MAKEGFGNRPLYFMLMLSEGMGRWPIGWLLPLPLFSAGGVGALWASRAPGPWAGLAAAGLLLALAVADYALFAYLPRRGLSFGPVFPPWLAMILLRAVVALALLPLLPRWPAAALVGLTMVELGGWLLLAYGTVIEPFRLQVTHLAIPSPKLANPGGRLRLAHLSDLHVERLTRRDEAIPGMVDEAAPDLILLTGDLLNTTYNRDPRAVADLRSLLGRLRAPGGVYTIWGTPEVDQPDVLRPVLDDAGIVLLEDSAQEVRVGEHRLWLMGLNCTRDLEAAGAKLQRLLAAAPPGALTVLLFHTPDLMPQAAELGIDLVLSGHTHGGQWRLPGFGALVTSSRFGKRYESGHVVEGRTHLYVSRGLGMEGYGTPRARFFCRPELVLITLAGA